MGARYCEPERTRASNQCTRYYPASHTTHICSFVNPSAFLGYDIRMAMGHHAYVIVGAGEAGVEAALAHAKREYGLVAEANPDVIVRTHGLFSVDDVRGLIELANQAPIAGEHKAIVVSASRVYHEAQNALLKLFEEPPKGTTLYLVLPSLGQLLPTLRSRVAVLYAGETKVAPVSTMASEFVRSTREKRSEMIQKLTAGADESERRQHRDEALVLVNEIEALLARHDLSAHHEVLRDIALLRGYLYDRSAPVKLILEHISLVLPSNLKYN